MNIFKKFTNICRFFFRYVPTSLTYIGENTLRSCKVSPPVLYLCFHSNFCFRTTVCSKQYNETPVEFDYNNFVLSGKSPCISCRIPGELFHTYFQEIPTFPPYTPAAHQVHSARTSQTSFEKLPALLVCVYPFSPDGGLILFIPCVKYHILTI